MTVKWQYLLLCLGLFFAGCFAATDVNGHDPNDAGHIESGKAVSTLSPKAVSELKQPVFFIWPEGTAGIYPEIAEKAKPCNRRFFNIHNPNVTLYRPEKPNGTAVILFCGGAYNYVATGVEGTSTAEKLNAIGVTAFVLKYRLPAQFKHPAQLHDGIRAVQWVRFHAGRFGIDPDKIGIAGFSAGGHLASMVGTQYDQMPHTDAISNISPRPDFMCLVYPIITAHQEGVAHGCVRQLLESGCTQKELMELSSELHVTGNTPPAFLTHAKDDGSVTYLNSQLMYDTMTAKNVPAEIVIYQQGGHGGGFGREGVDSEQWFGRFSNWLVEMNFAPSN